MIQEIYIKDFKSYQSARLKLSPLTMLIGANASGKSNALEAIRFLNWLAQGQKLSALQYKVNENDQVVRGKIEDLPRAGLQRFTLGGSISGREYNQLEVSFEVREGGELHIDGEKVLTSEGHPKSYPLYQIKKPSAGRQTAIEIEYNNFARGGKKPLLSGTDQTAVFLQLMNASRFAEGHKKSSQIIPSTAKAFEKHLLNIVFLDPVPSRMRGYSFESDYTLLGDGSNLSSTLHYLLKSGNPNRAANKQALLDFIASLPEQAITDIDFIHTPRKEVMLQLTESFGGINRSCEAALLSDGTLRILAFGAILLSAKEGSTVIVEEVDNGVHPSRAHKLLATMHKLAKERQLTLLLSSHNPALLDALPDDAVPKVVFCYRNPETGYSELVAMEDIPYYPELIAQGSLGELLTRGLVDRFVKQQESSSDRKKKALDWLESIAL
jgi:predicted ATPase